MSNILEYKGYYTEIKFSTEDKVLYGKIEFIDDLINFESETVKGIEEEFHSAVDDYIEYCKLVGKEPQKPYKGSFNVRVSPELHKKAANESLKRGCSLNAFVEQAIKDSIEGKHKHSANMTFNFYAKAEEAHNKHEQSISLYDQVDVSNVWGKSLQS